MSYPAMFNRLIGPAVLAILAASAAAANPLALRTLSNRADLISGEDALVEVVLPAGISAADVRVSLAGADVIGAFKVRSDGRLIGYVEGLAPGSNTLYARVVSTGQSARLTIVDHPVGGPIFSGAQLQPWICAHPAATPVTVTVPGTSLSASVNSKASGLLDGPLNDQCDASAKFTYFYQPKALQGSSCTFATTGANACFVAYDPASAPADADIADFTNDRGVTVKSKVRLELGTMNRGMYQVVTFYDPSRDVAAAGLEREAALEVRRQRGGEPLPAAARERASRQRRAAPRASWSPLPRSPITGRTRTTPSRPRR